MNGLLGLSIGRHTLFIGRLWIYINICGEVLGDVFKALLQQGAAERLQREGGTTGVFTAWQRTNYLIPREITSK